MPDERRRYSRSRTEHPVEIRTDDGRVLRGTLHDVSNNGVFVACEAPLPQDTACHVTILLTGAEPPVRIESEARVTRATDEGLGLHIVAEDLESHAHLVRLVLFNAQDPARVELELRQAALALGPVEGPAAQG